MPDSQEKETVVRVDGYEPRVILKGRAGLGNRLYFLTHGIVYALATNRRLVVDWRDKTYSDDGGNAFPDYFTLKNVPMLSVAEGQRPCRSIYPTLWDGQLHKSVVECQKEFQAKHPEADKEELYRMLAKGVGMLELDRPEEVVVLWEYHHLLNALPAEVRLRFFPTTESNAIVRTILTLYLEVTPRVREAVAAFRDSFFQGRHVIGIHVRSSDKWPRVSLERGLRMVTRLLTRTEDAVVFLATDNQSVLAEFQNRLGAHRVLSTEKWYPPVGKPAHQNSRCPSRRQNGFEALIDLYLLSHTDLFLFQDESSFSRIVPLLTDRPLKMASWQTSSLG